VKLLSDAPLLSRLMASPTKAILGWKGSPVSNTLAYYKHFGPEKNKWYQFFAGKSAPSFPSEKLDQGILKGDVSLYH
jgi:hypothetical protein